MLRNVRKILARNVKRLMALSADSDPDLSSNAKLAKKCSTPSREIGATTIQRLVDEDSDSHPQLDTIDAVADAFKLPAWVLLTDFFDPETRTIGGVAPDKLLDLAKKIAMIPEDKRDWLMQLFTNKSGVLASQAVDTNDLVIHDAAAPYGHADRRRQERRRPQK